VRHAIQASRWTLHPGMISPVHTKMKSILLLLLLVPCILQASTELHLPAFAFATQTPGQFDRHWRVQGTRSNIRFAGEEAQQVLQLELNSPGRLIAQTQFDLNPEWTHLGMRISMRGQNIKSDEQKPWRCPRITVNWIDADGNLNRKHQKWVGLQWDQEWGSYRLLATIPKGSRKANVEIGIYDASGTFELRDVQVTANPELPLPEADPRVPIRPLPGTETVVYKQAGDFPLQLHILRPEGVAEPRPALLLIHGGGWSGGHPRKHLPQARHFRERGLVTVCAEYRIHGRHKSSVSDAIADGRSAIRYLRAHADRFGIDPDRIIVFGGSAGGHVAASAMCFDQFDDPSDDHTIRATPDILLLFNPVVDTTKKGYGAATILKRDRIPPESISPLHHLPEKTVPTLVQHGTADRTTPFSNAEAFVAALKEKGGVAELVPYEGQGHGFFNGGMSYYHTLLRADRFLVKQGYLPAVKQIIPRHPDRVD